MFGIVAIVAVTCQHFLLVDAFEADQRLAHEDYDYDDNMEDASLDAALDFARLLQAGNDGGEGEGEGEVSDGGATPFPTPKPPTPVPTELTPAPTAPTPPPQTLAPPTPVPPPATISLTYAVQLLTKAAAFDAEAFKKAIANAAGVADGQGGAELDFIFTFSVAASYSAPKLITEVECVSLMAGVYNVSEASIKCKVQAVAGDFDNAAGRRLLENISIMDVIVFSNEQDLIEGIETQSADTSSILEAIATQLDVPVEAVVETKAPESSVDVAVKVVAEANSEFVEVEPGTLAEEVSKEIGAQAKVEVIDRATTGVESLCAAHASCQAFIIAGVGCEDDLAEICKFGAGEGERRLSQEDEVEDDTRGEAAHRELAKLRGKDQKWVPGLQSVTIKELCLEEGLSSVCLVPLTDTPTPASTPSTPSPSAGTPSPTAPSTPSSTPSPTPASSAAPNATQPPTAVGPSPTPSVATPAPTTQVVLNGSTPAPTFPVSVDDDEEAAASGLSLAGATLVAIVLAASA